MTRRTGRHGVGPHPHCLAGRRCASVAVQGGREEVERIRRRCGFPRWRRSPGVRCALSRNTRLVDPKERLARSGCVASSPADRVDPFPRRGWFLERLSLSSRDHFGSIQELGERLESDSWGRLWGLSVWGSGGSESWPRIALRRRSAVENAAKCLIPLGVLTYGEHGLASPEGRWPRNQAWQGSSSAATHVTWQTWFWSMGERMAPGAGIA